MQPFRYHVLACDQKKPEGLSCCSGRGSAEVIEVLRRELGAHGLLDEVQLTLTGSLGLCECGPNLVVYPDGVWYSGVTPADVKEIVVDHFASGRPVARLVNHDENAVRLEILANRERMIAAQKAREAAGALPEELMEAIRGYQPSRILLSALELDVFSAIAALDGAATAAQVAVRIGTNPRATEVLLNALVALGVLSKLAGAYTNSPAAARFFVTDPPDDSRRALCHNLSLWETWSRLTETLRTGEPAPSREMARRDDDWTIPFIAAMHKNAGLRAPIVVKAVGADSVTRLLDVGGGSAAYSIAFARANPALQATVFDLETVVPIAERHIAQAKLSARIKTHVGDLRRDVLPDGQDLVLLSAICHMLGPDENRDLLQRVHAALLSGGRVVIQDHVMRDDKTTPRAGALFAINMLVGTSRGSTYSEVEYRQWLEQAGFCDVSHLPLPGPNDLMMGTRR